MAAIYRENDVDPMALVDRRIAVLGYGSLGRPIALNLRDSGLKVAVGSLADDYAAQAQADGFEVTTLSEAARRSDVVWLLVPDEAIAEVYVQHVSPSLKPGKALVFASGYCVTFGFVEAPSFVDTLLIAPRTVGAAVREHYLSGRGYRSMIAVGQDGTGYAWKTGLALAGAIGALRIGALETTFQQETELDLFVQQAVLPALHYLLLTAADLLIRDGYPPEAALLDLYLSGELGYALSVAAESGVGGMLALNALTGQYGTLSRIDRFADPKLRRQMEIVLEDIRSGKFAQEWAAEYAAGYPRLQSLKQRRESLPLWQQEQAAFRQWQTRERPQDKMDNVEPV
jgi:ketol-acid reductoisomerase